MCGAIEALGNFIGGAVNTVAPVLEKAGDYAAGNPTIMLGPVAGALGGLSALDAGMGAWDMAGAAADVGGVAAGAGGAFDMGGWSGTGLESWYNALPDAAPAGGLDAGMGAYELAPNLANTGMQVSGNTLQMAAPVAQSAAGYGVPDAYGGSLTGQAADLQGAYGAGADSAYGGASYMQQLLEKAKANPFQALNTLGSVANMGTSIYGMMQAPKLAQAGQAAAERAAGPWNNMGYQANAATNLNTQLQDPNAYYSTPEYKANEQAVMRKMAAYGNSGNLATALQQSGAQGRNQYLQTLGGFAGVNNNPAAGAALAMQGQTNAANLQMNSLGLAGKTAVAATNNNNNWWS